MGHMENSSVLDEMRIDLAAAFRLAVMFDLHESIDNHFSYAVDDERFLINPYGIHWALMRAGDVLLANGDGDVLEGRHEIEPTALHIHGAIHRAHPRARAVLHTHMPYATAITCQQGGRLEPVSQTAALYLDQIAYDDDYGGLGDNREEGDRLAAAMGDKPILFMGNHGIITTGETIAQAFNSLYYIERAARLQILGAGAGKSLRLLPRDVVEKTAAGWDFMQPHAEKHFAALRAVLDRDQSDYADLTVGETE